MNRIQTGRCLIWRLPDNGWGRGLLKIKKRMIKRGKPKRGTKRREMGRDKTRMMRIKVRNKLMRLCPYRWLCERMLFSLRLATKRALKNMDRRIWLRWKKNCRIWEIPTIMGELAFFPVGKHNLLNKMHANNSSIITETSWQQKEGTNNPNTSKSWLKNTNKFTSTPKNRSGSSATIS